MWEFWKSDSTLSPGFVVVAAAIVVVVVVSIVT